MDEELLKLFAEFYEKQDIVQRLYTQPFIHQYGHSELHCIDAVGRYEDPNVSLIAQKLAITRGAACKITKKLLARGDISSYQRETNRKEIYFALTEHGKKVFAAHEKRHNIWMERDLKFLERVPLADKRVVREFLQGFINYLQEEIARSDTDTCA